MTKAMELWGNPSSTHTLGRQANELLEDSRAKIAKVLNISPSTLIFTSGGSEANTAALLDCFFQHQKDFKLLVSPVEHAAVSNTAELIEKLGGNVRYLKVKPTGELDFEDFCKQLDSFQPTLVSCMAANNETGVIYPTKKMYEICREKRVLFHTDAVQAFGKMDPADWKMADMVCISAHKIFGPKGVGALIVRPGIKLVQMNYGGSQEIKRRGGTQNMIGIAGFAAAAEKPCPPEDLKKLEGLRDRFESTLKEKFPEMTIQGLGAPRVPNTSNLRFPGISGEILLSALDLDGLCVSAGSACSSGSVSASHVLLALGLSDQQARECMRISWCIRTTDQEINEANDIISRHVTRIKQRHATA